MNEADRAAFHLAEGEYMSLDLDESVMNEVEVAWVSGDARGASERLSKASDGRLTVKQARALLRRHYDG